MFNLSKFFKGLFTGGKITNVILLVKKETAGIKDPVLRVDAVMQSILLHSRDLPANLCGKNLRSTVEEIAQGVLDLPIDEIRAIVKEYLDKV